MVRAWCNGEKFCRRPGPRERPLPPGVHALEDLREACDTLGLQFPEKAQKHEKPTIVLDVGTHACKYLHQTDGPSVARERMSRLSGQQKRKRALAKHGREHPTLVAKRAFDKQRITRNRIELLAFVTALKLERGCVDCGYRSHPEALDFDHLPGVSKKHGIAQMIGGWNSKEYVLAEIAKCEVVCSNCHRVRTLKRRRGATG